MLVDGSGKRTIDVSIHAPAKGATIDHRRACAQVRGFNPRPREGGDQSVIAMARCIRCFNPRPREGGDAGQVALRRIRECFNPRPREGGDISRLRRRSPARVSIHAPAKGATC